METEISDNNPYPALTPPDLLSVPSGLARSQFHAMGTTISFLVPLEALPRAEEIVRTLFADWEQTLSRFLPDSGLSQLNRLAGNPVIVEELLFDVLSRALVAAQATNGIYDPTLLNQLAQLGYDRSFDELPVEQPAIVHSTEPGGRWRDMQLVQALRMVTLPAGVAVDFGGIAKGMAVDAALQQLGAEGIQIALVNAGGDLAVRGVPVLEQQWPIEVQGKNHSWVIPLKRGAMATSGVSRRHWQQGTQTRHHLLDPRTGLPAQSGLWSVTVVADSGEQAEVAAKVAFLLGEEQGVEFLHRHDLSGLLVHTDGSWTTAGYWPKEAML
ncbi:MAG TPA: FAD:protein FMN transferase [Ktedonobacteraceae bacterium]|nr:FAD:protein FMN transferase [Ktedonobacteraceae bacterium]